MPVSVVVGSQRERCLTLVRIWGMVFSKWAKEVGLVKDRYNL